MSQVNFFMVAEDEQAFLDMVLAEPGAGWLLGQFHKSRTPSPIRRAPRFGTPRKLVLVNEKVRSPTFLSADGEGEYGGLYCHDMFRDPHIDLDRCYIRARTLHAGRIYAKIGWCPAPSENDLLKKWYSALARSIKRGYVKADPLYWVGPHAVEWLRKGGKADPDVKTQVLHSAR